MVWTVPPSKHSSITGRGKGVTCAFYLLSLFSENGLVSSLLFTPFDDHEPVSTVLVKRDRVPHEMYSSSCEAVCLEISHLCVRHGGSLPFTKNRSTVPYPLHVATNCFFRIHFKIALLQLPRCLVVLEFQINILYAFLISPWVLNNHPPHFLIFRNKQRLMRSLPCLRICLSVCLSIIFVRRLMRSPYSLCLCSI